MLLLLHYKAHTMTHTARPPLRQNLSQQHVCAHVGVRCVHVHKPSEYENRLMPGQQSTTLQSHIVRESWEPPSAQFASMQAESVGPKGSATSCVPARTKRYSRHTSTTNPSPSIWCVGQNHNAKQHHSTYTGINIHWQASSSHKEALVSRFRTHRSTQSLCYKDPT